MKTFRRICNILSEICCYLSAVACVAMMVLVTVDTTGRSLFKKPVIGSFELCQYLLCVILFGGYAYCQQKHGFLHVTMFIRKLPKKVYYAVLALVSIFAIVVVGMLAFQCFKQAQYDVSVHAISTLLKVPKAPFEYFAFVSLCIMILDLICDTISSIIGIFNTPLAEQLLED